MQGVEKEKITVWLDPELKSWLNRYSKSESITISQSVRKAILDLKEKK